MLRGLMAGDWSRGCLRSLVGLWRGLDLADLSGGWKVAACHWMRGWPGGEMEEGWR